MHTPCLPTTTTPFFATYLPMLFWLLVHMPLHLPGDSATAWIPSPPTQPVIPRHVGDAGPAARVLHCHGTGYEIVPTCPLKALLPALHLPPLCSSLTERGRDKPSSLCSHHHLQAVSPLYAPQTNTMLKKYDLLLWGAGPFPGKRRQQPSNHHPTTHAQIAFLVWYSVCQHPNSHRGPLEGGSGGLGRHSLHIPITYHHLPMPNLLSWDRMMSWRKLNMPMPADLPVHITVFPLQDQ